MKLWFVPLLFLTSAYAQAVTAPGCLLIPGGTASCDPGTLPTTLPSDCIVPPGVTASLPAHYAISQPTTNVQPPITSQPTPQTQGGPGDCYIAGPGWVASLPSYCMSTLPNGQVTIFTNGLPSATPTVTNSPSISNLIGSGTSTNSQTGTPNLGSSGATRRVEVHGWITSGLLLAVVVL